MWNQQDIFKEKIFFLVAFWTEKRCSVFLVLWCEGGGRILIRKGISPTMGDLGVGNLSSHRIWCRFLKRKDFFFLFQKSNLS